MRVLTRHRPPFDARYNFVVTPPAGRPELPVGGAALLAGAPFDKSLVDGRRLRQMYAARLIAVAPGHAPLPAKPSRPRAIGPHTQPPDLRSPSQAGDRTVRGVARRTSTRRVRAA